MNNYQGETFLNRLYKDLHMSDEVMHTANSSDTKDEKVTKYLERLERVEELAKNNNYNGIELLKEMYYKKYVIKPENVPESYFEKQKKIALERGFGHVEISSNERNQMIGNIIEDQKKSLDAWLDYFISSDAMYPEWFKYYAFQGMLKLGSYDKEKGSFNKRTDSTTNIFIDLNREALALVYDNLCSVLDGQNINDEVLQRLLENGSFSKLYSYMLEKIDSNRKDISDSNDGIWVKYNQGSEPDELVKSLEGKGTGWCTAGIQTARTQLQGGDFHVYYTKDSNGEYKQPRIAIRMEGNYIGEIRGINESQNLEPEMEDILDKKLEEFPDKDKYKKKVKDMEKLTTIYKEYGNTELSLEDLRFLYEIDHKIEGFGYQTDSRIKEILYKRNLKKDLSKLFNCTEEEISDNKNDIFNGKKIVYFCGSLDLRYLTSAEGLKLPNCIRGSLDLRSLTSAEGLNLPDIVGGSLNLSSLTSAEDLKLPDTVGGTLNLSSLTSAEGLKLPDTLGGSLDLSSLKNADSLTLPNSVGGYLSLRNLTSVAGLTLPNSVGSLDLGSLTNAEGLKLPNTVGGILYLNRLTNVEGLIVPKNFNCDSVLSDYITKGDLEAKSLEDSNERVLQRGFSKVGLLVILNLIVSIGLIVLGLLFTV